MRFFPRTTLDINKYRQKGDDYMIEALTSILTFLANVWIDIIGFIASQFEENNYIALAAILAGFVLLGIIIGIVKYKIKPTRKF